MAGNNALTLPVRPDVKPPTACSEPTAFGIPSYVSRFDRAAFQFAKSDPPVTQAEAPEGRPDPVPFTMLARTGSAITHWYWGAIIHDMAGFKARKDVVCIDYCHNPQEIIGYADSQTATDEGLTLSGALIPMDDDDRASEVVYKASKKIPYEASIDFDYLSVEWVPDKATTKVNGGTFTGPGYVVREWTIAGSAVCPYGADPDTWTSFAASENQTRSVTLFSKTGVALMTTTVTEGGTGTDATKTTATELSAAQVKANMTAELKKFTTKFGAENGAAWFADKTYEEALELHVGVQDEVIKKLKADLDAAETKLANAPKGEDSTVSTSDADTKKTGFSKKNPVQSNISKFAQANKIPGAN